MMFSLTGRRRNNPTHSTNRVFILPRRTLLLGLLVATIVFILRCFQVFPGYHSLVLVKKKPYFRANRPISKLLQPLLEDSEPETGRELSAFFDELEMKGAGFNSDLPKSDWCVPQPRFLPLPPDNQYDCWLPYVTMNPEGRLGNNICQYMALAVLRKVFGVRVAMAEDMNSHLGSIFSKLSLPVEDHKCFSGYTAEDTFIELYKKLAAKSPRRSRAMFDLQLHNYPLKESVYVSDFPCPAHLLLPLRDQFRQEFAFSEEVLQAARTALEDAVKSLYTNPLESLTIITVHVRRTDYLKHVKSIYKEYPVDMTYFHEAFNFFRNRTDLPVFVVTSDDPQWCQTNFIDEDIVFAGSNDPVVDLALLSLGDHHVITDGTYGFCGAFLGRGIIVYPDPNGWPVYPCFSSSILQPIVRNYATLITPHVSILVHCFAIYILVQHIQCN